MAPLVLLDIDGVLTVSWQALDGAVETLEWLDDRGHDVRFLTNTSSIGRMEIARRLDDAGMPVDPSHIVTSVSAAASYIHEVHPGAGCLVLNQGDLSDDLEGLDLVGPDEAGVVLLGGAGPDIGYEELNQAFTLALAGVPLVALHRNTRFETADGLALDMGAFLVGLEAAAHTTATIVGKPAEAIFRAALSEIGADAGHAVMVGDDIESDVLGAQAVGITGVLVRTGKFRPGDLEGSSERPDHVIDEIGDLPALLDSLSEAD